MNECRATSCSKVTLGLLVLGTNEVFELLFQSCVVFNTHSKAVPATCKDLIVLVRIVWHVSSGMFE